MSAFVDWLQSSPKTSGLFAEAQKKAHQDLLEQDIFSSKHEKLRYFPMQEMKRSVFTLTSKHHFDPSGSVVKECQNNVLVLINGQYQPQLSKLSKDLWVCSLKQGLSSFGMIIKNRLNKALSKEKDPFALLHQAFFQDGIVIHVPEEKKKLPPLQILHVCTESVMAYPKITCFVAKGSCLDVLETVIAEKQSLYAPLVDVALEEKAHLHWGGHLYSEGFLSPSYQGTLQKESHSSFTLASHLQNKARVRANARFTLQQPQAKSGFYAMHALQQQAHGHTHVLMDHESKDTFSDQLIQSMLWDESVCSFEGKIAIAPCCGQINSYQMSKSLFLPSSDGICKAKSYTKPNLEIFTDDVKASHGATVSKLSQEQLFYLSCRGIPQKKATELLLQAFYQQVLDKGPTLFAKQVASLWKKLL